MDIRELLQNVLNEIDVKIDDPLVASEVEAVKKQLSDSIDAIDEIGANRQQYMYIKRKNRFIMRLMFPYIIYLSMVIDQVPVSKTHNNVFNREFITEILQKHLDIDGNNT